GPPPSGRHARRRAGALPRAGRGGRVRAARPEPRRALLRPTRAAGRRARPARRRAGRRPDAGAPRGRVRDRGLRRASRGGGGAGRAADLRTPATRIGRLPCPRPPVRLTPASSMYFHFANVIVFILLSFVLCGLMLGLGLLLRPANPSPAKLSTYECGEPPSGS